MNLDELVSLLREAQTRVHFPHDYDLRRRIDAALAEAQDSATDVVEWDEVCREAGSKTIDLGYFGLILVGLKLDPDDSNSVITDITSGVAPELSEESRNDLMRYAAQKLLEQTEAKSAAIAAARGMK